LGTKARREPERPEDDGFADSLVGYEITRPVNQDLLVQLRVSFWLAVGLIVVGVGLLFWAVLSGADLKSVKTVAGIVVNVLGGFALKLYTNIGERLALSCRHEELNAVIRQISDAGKRDDALVQYANSLQPKKGWLKRLTGR
jgi:hypothetical protein